MSVFRHTHTIIEVTLVSHSRSSNYIGITTITFFVSEFQLVKKENNFKI